MQLFKAILENVLAFGVGTTKQKKIENFLHFLLKGGIFNTFFDGFPYRFIGVSPRATQSSFCVMSKVQSTSWVSKEIWRHYFLKFNSHLFIWTVLYWVLLALDWSPALLLGRPSSWWSCRPPPSRPPAAPAATTRSGRSYCSLPWKVTPYQGDLYINQNITFAAISISNEGVSVKWIPTIYNQVKDCGLQI